MNDVTKVICSFALGTSIVAPPVGVAATIAIGTSASGSEKLGDDLVQIVLDAPPTH